MKSALCVLEPVCPLDPGGSFRRSMFCHGCTCGGRVRVGVRVGVRVRVRVGVGVGVKV